MFRTKSSLHPFQPKAVVLIFLLFVAFSKSAIAENLIIELSQNAVAVESNFTGANLTLFGAIERDSQTVARRGGYDIVVVVRGPRSSITVRRKERLAGIWVNRGLQEFIDAPGYLAVLSNRKLSEIASDNVLERFQLGLKQTALLTPDNQTTDLTEEEQQYQKAVIRILSEKKLFVQESDSVKFLSDNLFRTDIKMPAGIPVGVFEVETFLLADGAMIKRELKKIDIHKSGFEQLVYTMAVDYPFVYGVLAVMMAIFAGWAANVVFKKD